MNITRAFIYTKAAIQALVQHRKYGVSGAYMELILRIEMLRKLEHWSNERYKQELMAMARHYPEDMKKHMHYFGVSSSGVK